MCASLCCDRAVYQMILFLCVLVATDRPKCRILCRSLWRIWRILFALNICCIFSLLSRQRCHSYGVGRNLHRYRDIQRFASIRCASRAETGIRTLRSEYLFCCHSRDFSDCHGEVFQCFVACEFLQFGEFNCDSVADLWFFLC